MHRAPPRTPRVRDPGADEEQYGHHAPSGPRDGDERGENAAGFVVPAPREVAPVVLLGALER